MKRTRVMVAVLLILGGLSSISLSGCGPKGAEPTKADAQTDQQKVNDSMKQAYGQGGGRPGMGAPGAPGSTSGGAMPPPQGGYGRPPR